MVWATVSLSASVIGFTNKYIISIKKGRIAATFFLYSNRNSETLDKLVQFAF